MELFNELINKIYEEEYKEMPYVRKGKSVYKKVDGLKKVGSSKSVSKAKNYQRLLNAIHHGWKPTGKGSK